MSTQDTGEETVESLKAKLAETEGKLASATGELIENRASRQTVEGERDALKVKITELEGRVVTPPAGEQPKVEDVVRAVLSERDQKDADRNRATAEATFRAAHSEFHPDNDPGGLKFDAIKAKLSRFSFGDMMEVSDFLSVYEDAFTLVNPKRADAGTTTYAPYASTVSHPSTTSRETETTGLGSKETKLIERMGWTAEQFQKQMQVRPTYVKSLLLHMD